MTRRRLVDGALCLGVGVVLAVIAHGLAGVVGVGLVLLGVVSGAGLALGESDRYRRMRRGGRWRS